MSVLKIRKSRVLLILFFISTYSTYGLNKEMKSHNEDTVTINISLKNASRCEKNNTDSAAVYYEKTIKDCEELLEHISITSRSTSETLKKKYIEAELGLGLIYYRKLAYDKALLCFESGYKKAEDLNDPYFLGECLFNYAETYLEQSRYKLAMTNYFDALQKYTEINDKSGIYWCYIGMGIVQKQCGNYPDAVSCYEKSYRIAFDSGMKLKAGYSLNNLGIIYRRQGNLSEAMKMYEKALNCFNEMNDELSASDCMNNIANIFLDKGDPSKALEYLKRSIESEKVKADAYRMISRFSNMADAWVALHDYKNAHTSIAVAVKLAEKSQDKLMQASCYSQKGNVLLKTGKTEEGLSYLEQSVNIFSSIGSKVEEANGLVDLANAESSAGKIDNALFHAEKAMRIADSAKVLKTTFLANECLSGLLGKKGNTARALAYLTKAFSLKDSIFNLEKNRTVEEIEASFTQKKLENENQLLQQKNKIQQQSIRIRNVISYSLLTCLAFALVTVWLLHKRHIDAKEIAIQKEAFKQSEIDRLNESLLFKERELTTKALFINRENHLLNRLISEFEEIKREDDKGVRIKITRLQHELKMELSPNAWKEFEIQFNEVHPEFQTRLLEKFPDLTPAERRLCAFLRLNMNTREVASITGQTFKSIEVARTRIRKKLGISHESNLANFITSL
jgi:tetratricopeptide (TPR) repeat protein